MKKSISEEKNSTVAKDLWVSPVHRIYTCLPNCSLMIEASSLLIFYLGLWLSIGLPDDSLMSEVIWC